MCSKYCSTSVYFKFLTTLFWYKKQKTCRLFKVIQRSSIVICWIFGNVGQDQKYLLVICYEFYLYFYRIFIDPKKKYELTKMQPHSNASELKHERSYIKTKKLIRTLDIILQCVKIYFWSFAIRQRYNDKTMTILFLFSEKYFDFLSITK